MSGPLRRGRAVLQRVLCTSPSNVHHSVSSEYLQTIVSACVRTSEHHLAQPALLSRSLGHTSWQPATANAEVILGSCQSNVLSFHLHTQSAPILAPIHADMSSVVQECKDQALDVEALQTRRVSGSSASTSSSSFFLPAGRADYSTRHFSSSRDASSAEGPAKDTSPSLKGRASQHSEAKTHRRSRYAAKRAGLSDTAAEGSAATSSGAHEGKRPVGNHKSFAAKGLSGSSSATRARSAADRDADDVQSAASSSQQSSHRAGRSRDREVPAESTKSKRTRQLEAMAAEMLPEDEQKGAQPAAPPKQRLAGHLRFPE